jgi:predicted Zn-dependent peptidase
MKNVREEKGYTYGIDSVLVSQLEAGYMVIISEVGADVCKLALAEIYKEINILKNELVTQEELETVKNVLLGEMLREFDGPFSLSSKLKTSLLYASDFAYYSNFIRALKAIQPEKLIELANTYFVESEFYEVVAGKM